MKTSKLLNIQYLRLLTSIVLIVIGGMIYVVYRPLHLVMFEWFHELGLDSFIHYLRFLCKDIELNPFIVYNIPASLWLLSYFFIIDFIWNGIMGWQYKLFIFFMALIAMASEILQSLSIISGTFDYLDLLSYILSIISFYLYKKHFKHE